MYILGMQPRKWNHLLGVATTTLLEVTFWHKKYKDKHESMLMYEKWCRHKNKIKQLDYTMRKPLIVTRKTASNEKRMQIK